jgi:hypothetical protein
MTGDRSQDQAEAGHDAGGLSVGDSACALVPVDVAEDVDGTSGQPVDEPLASAMRSVESDLEDLNARAVALRGDGGSELVPVVTSAGEARSQLVSRRAELTRVTTEMRAKAQELWGLQREELRRLENELDKRRVELGG